MNKGELIEAIAKTSGESQATVGRVLDGFVETVKTSLQKGDSINLVGFGSFSVSERAARTGRNPRTGEELQIAAGKVARFKPGAGLSGVLNPKAGK